MPSTSLAYRALIRSGIALAPAFSVTSPKVRAGIAGRGGAIDRLLRWSRAERDPTRPLLWMHAASVGEGLQAGAVLQRLRHSHPDWQIAYTYFSPSAVALAESQPADLTEYLPWDRVREVQAALQALRPAALVFSKLDLWPELATRAAAAGTAVGIIAASVSPHARRLRWPGRALLRPGYRVVSAAGAVAEADVARLARLGVPADRIQLTGDPRCDSALERARGVRSDDPWLSFAGSGPVLVAGSTWPADEDQLLAAFRIVQSTLPNAGLVIVPHEPTPERIERLVRRARGNGFDPKRLRSAGAPHPLLVVDRIGILATLYAGATIAYVGGGYGTRGLHSVLEPAACGAVVLFGPHWRGNSDAAALVARRAAAAATDEFSDWLGPGRAVTRPAGNRLALLWLALLRDPAGARAAGGRGREYVEAGLGAAARNAGLVELLMRGGPASAR